MLAFVKGLITTGEKLGWHFIVFCMLYNFYYVAFLLVKDSLRHIDNKKDKIVTFLKVAGVITTKTNATIDELTRGTIANKDIYQ